MVVSARVTALLEEALALLRGGPVDAPDDAVAAAYARGEKAGKAGRSEASCPYPYDDLRRCEWLRGLCMGLAARAKREACGCRPMQEVRPKAYRLGQEARKAGRKRSSNPYATYRGGYQRAWYEGWDAG